MQQFVFIGIDFAIKVFASSRT